MRDKALRSLTEVKVKQAGKSWKLEERGKREGMLADAGLIMP